MKPALVLFDVDGTLLITQGATSRCILHACRELFGKQFDWADITVGTLDQQIFAELCAANGVAGSSSRLDEYRRIYLGLLEHELARIRDGIIVLPGVRELLDQLDAMPGMTRGIVSGNFRRAVELKLENASIDGSRFPIMACAEDGDSRLDLPHIAMQSYERLHGEPIPPDRVFIIGDTPRDIECARACGARAIVVATGRYDTDALARHHPDIQLSSLNEMNVRQFAM